MDWRLALVAFSVLPLIVLVTQWFRRNVRESYRDGARLDRAHQRVPAGEHHRDGDGAAVPARGARTSRASTRSTAATATRTSSRSSTTRCSTRPSRSIGALAVGADHLVRRRPGASRGALTLGSLVAFLQYSQRFFRPISDMSEKFNVLQAAMASSERIFKLLDTPVTIVSAAGAAAAAGSASARRPRAGDRQPEPAGHIVFDHVWFAYNGEDYVLRDVSLRGRSRASASASSARPGAGKTTLINLLLRFYDVSRGRILVDGVDIRDLDAAATCAALFSLVLQDVHLFSGTIAEQHPAGRRRDRRRGGAARGRRRCTPTRFIERLPHGLRRAQVAERGANAVGRPEAAAVVRARAGLRPARPDPRRGDVERGHRDRAAHPRRAAGADGRPHDDRHRAPALDDPGHGQILVLPQGRAARVGHPPGTARRSAASTTGSTSCSTRSRKAAVASS